MAASASSRGIPCSQHRCCGLGMPHGHALSCLASSVCGQGQRVLGKWASGRTGDPISPSEAGTNVCCPVLPRGRGAQCRWDPVAGTSQVVAGQWGCSVQTGPGGRNLPSGGGVSHRSAPGGSEERLSDHLRRGDSEASWGRWAGSRAWGVWGRRLEVLRSLDPSSPAPPAGGEPEPIREAPAEGGPCAPRSGEPPSLSGPLPRCSCREASLPSLSFHVPSLPPRPSVSSSRQLAESRIHSWTADGGKASPGAPHGVGSATGSACRLTPRCRRRSGRLGLCLQQELAPCPSVSWPCSQDEGREARVWTANRSNTVFTACWEPAVSS